VERRIRWGGGETQGLIKDVGLFRDNRPEQVAVRFDLIPTKNAPAPAEQAGTKLSGPQPTDVQIWSTGLKSPSEIASWDNSRSAGVLS